MVATPIGNPEDITLRALRILGQVDLIAAEDTREAGKLLSRHQIKGALISCHNFNEQARCGPLLEKLKAGLNIALISDAGTPSVSDPGYRLVLAAIEHGLKVIPVPGVSALTTALSVSGLPTDAFVFVGFLPKKTGKRLEQLEALAQEPATVIFYESPKRLPALLAALLKIFGDRQAVLAREMTKTYEEFQRGRISELIATLAQRAAIKGECTLLVAGGASAAATDSSSMDIRLALRAALQQDGARLSQVVQKLAAEYHLPKKQLYEQALQIKMEEEGPQAED